MSSPDYPLLTLPSYEMYQLAHIATFIAERLARHRRAGRSDEVTREASARDVAAARRALDASLSRAAGTEVATPQWQLPQPLDVAQFEQARKYLAPGPRWAEVVSLEPIGGIGWAVIGSVPGIGPVGAKVASLALADSMRQHFVTQPPFELRSWAVTDKATTVPRLPKDVDLAEFVENLDPRLGPARAVARGLRGVEQRVDAAIEDRFRGIDLDVPLLPEPPSQSPRRPVPRPAPAPMSPHGSGRRTPQRPGTQPQR